MIETPYNPLDKRNLGASVAEALLARPASPLVNVVVERFDGAGIYALYYAGAFPAYTRIAERNRNGRFDAPIYIGKAVPKGARKGGWRDSDKPDPALCSRLRDHADSIAAAASTLDLADFYCRYLLVDDIWIPLGESLLIDEFQPVWNIVVEGFGNHAPGGGRYSGKIPLWDVLHPGRGWAAKCQPRTESPADIVTNIETHLDARSKLPRWRTFSGNEEGVVSRRGE